MKVALSALCLLCAFTTHLPSATAVVDVDGEPVSNGGSAYYILPAFRGKGGGLGLASIGNETCPLSVVQARSETSRGLPVRITSPLRIAFIKTGYLVDIAFDAVPVCAETPSKWTVVKEVPEGWSVKITGYENAVAGKFKIQKYGSDYKLVFCSDTSVTCANLGIYIDDDGNRRLVVNEEDPFRIIFKKVDSISAA